MAFDCSRTYLTSSAGMGAYAVNVDMFAGVESANALRPATMMGAIAAAFISARLDSRFGSDSATAFVSRSSVIRIVDMITLLSLVSATEAEILGSAALAANLVELLTHLVLGFLPRVV